MERNKWTKIILIIIVVITLSFLIVSVSLMIKPSRVGIAVDEVEVNEEDVAVYSDDNLKLFSNLTESALGLGILLFFGFIGFFVIRIFLINEKNREKLKGVSLMLLIVGIGVSLALIAYYIYVLIIFPKKYDEYNNYAYSLGIANIIFLSSLIIFSMLNIWKLYVGEQENKTTINIQLLTEGAMMVALSVVLSVLGDLIPWINLPYGGGVSLSMLPIFIFALRRGTVGGTLVGLSYGILNLLIDGVLHWGSIFFDYLIPYPLVGLLAGLFAKKAQKGLIGYTILAVFLGGFARYLFHSLSGMIFFGQWAPDGMTAFYYSFIAYNAPYMAINIVLCIAIIIVLQKRLITLDSRVV